MSSIPPNPDLDANSDPSARISIFDRLSNGFTNTIGRFVNLPKGAEPKKPGKTEPRIKSNLQYTKDGKDLRAKLFVPESYKVAKTFSAFGGLIFPYTPSISYDVKADYTSQNPVHTNFSHNFYQRSSVTAINLTAKFTVQNSNDAAYYLSAIHLLKSLTKMRVGDDFKAGSPPPVCRLSAYGPYMLKEVPVVVQSFRIELPDTVDYFTLGKNPEESSYGVVSVPTVSSFNINFLPMYSRREMQQFGVDKWLNEDNDSDFWKKGYL